MSVDVEKTFDMIIHDKNTQKKQAQRGNVLNFDKVSTKLLQITLYLKMPFPQDQKQNKYIYSHTFIQQSAGSSGLCKKARKINNRHKDQKEVKFI